MKYKSGTVGEVIEFGKKDLDFYYEHLDCETIDIVSAYGVESPELQGLCLVVDDEGMMKSGAILNPIASLLYGCLNHGQYLFGNVMVCKDKHTEDGTETVGLTDEEVILVNEEIAKLIEKHNSKIESR